MTGASPQAQSARLLQALVMHLFGSSFGRYTEALANYYGRFVRLRDHNKDVIVIASIDDYVFWMAKRTQNERDGFGVRHNQYSTCCLMLADARD
jgi:hypothetical protein